MIWNQIAELTNRHGYMSGVDRMTERVKKTAEIFTPTDLVIKMMKKMLAQNDEVFAPGKTILDPACGDGQLLVPVKHYKMLRYKLDEATALNDIYGVDIMRDNVDLCKRRLGGGHILMGNTLDPYTKLSEQTEFEHDEMIRIFGVDNLMSFFD